MSKRISVTPAVGDHVSVLDPFVLDPQWRGCVVVDLLSTQFTARQHGSERILYSFYRDFNVAWRYSQ